MSNNEAQPDTQESQAAERSRLGNWIARLKYVGKHRAVDIEPELTNMKMKTSGEMGSSVGMRYKDMIKNSSPNNATAGNPTNPMQEQSAGGTPKGEIWSSTPPDTGYDVARSATQMRESQASRSSAQELWDNVAVPGIPSNAMQEVVPAHETLRDVLDANQLGGMTPADLMSEWGKTVPPTDTPRPPQAPGPQPH